MRDGQSGEAAPQGSRALPILAPTELRVFCVLEDFVEERGWAPTLAELCVEMGWSRKSKTLAHRYLERFRLGLVTGSGPS